MPRPRPGSTARLALIAIAAVLLFFFAAAMSAGAATPAPLLIAPR